MGRDRHRATDAPCPRRVAALGAGSARIMGAPDSPRSDREPSPMLPADPTALTLLGTAVGKVL